MRVVEFIRQRVNSQISRLMCLKLEKWSTVCVRLQQDDAPGHTAETVQERFEHEFMVLNQTPNPSELDLVERPWDAMDKSALISFQFPASASVTGTTDTFTGLAESMPQCLRAVDAIRRNHTILRRWF